MKKVVLEHSWQIVVEMPEEWPEDYSSKEHMEFAWNLGTHCHDNDIHDLDEELSKKLRDDQLVEGQLSAFQLHEERWLDRFPFGCFCDVLITRWVREAGPDEPVGVIHPFKRWEDEGWS